MCKGNDDEVQTLRSTIIIYIEISIDDEILSSIHNFMIVVYTLYTWNSNNLCNTSVCSKISMSVQSCKTLWHSWLYDRFDHCLPQDIVAKLALDNSAAHILYLVIIVYDLDMFILHSIEFEHFVQNINLYLCQLATTWDFPFHLFVLLTARPPIQITISYTYGLVTSIFFQIINE